MSDYKRAADKKIQLVITEEDHQLLRQFAEEADVTQGFIVHSYLELTKLMVGTAIDRGIIDDLTRIPNLEAFIALVMLHIGLLDANEFERAVQLSDVMKGENSNLRLQGLAVYAHERVEELRPFWEVARIEAKAKRAAAWLDQVSAVKQAIAQNVGAQMVAVNEARQAEEANKVIS